MTAGHVYAARVPGERRVKIGMTSGSPETRLRALNNTSVVDDFRIEFALAVRDRRAVEAQVHERLAGCRVRDDREFFRCSPRRARAEIRRAAASVEREGAARSGAGRAMRSVGDALKALAGVSLLGVAVAASALLALALVADAGDGEAQAVTAVPFGVLCALAALAGLGLIRSARGRSGT